MSQGTFDPKRTRGWKVNAQSIMTLARVPTTEVVRICVMRPFVWSIVRPFFWATREWTGLIISIQSVHDTTDLGDEGMD